jgi:Taurine catabolism dioxygenase TauD, TfdA family
VELLASDLERDGWCRFASGADCEADIVVATDRTAELLGRTTTGRAGAARETITPCIRANAHPRSQSARHGLNAIPLHVELSHRPVPCRYVVLGCINSGKSTSATTTLDWRTLQFTSDEIALLKGAPLLVRNGRKSFYSTAIPSDERFLRFDCECLEAVDARGLAALDTIKARLSSVLPAAHQLQRGDVLVIDNWRMLHGREAVPALSGRILTRRLVNA